MPNLEAVTKLAQAINELTDVIAAAREQKDEKQGWFVEESQTYQESEEGQEWGEYLENAENLISGAEFLETDFADL